MKTLAWMLAAVAAGAVAAPAPPVGPALERAAIAVRAPERAVLLGAALAGARTVAVGERGVITFSDDGGRHWQQASVPTSVTLTAVRFADAQRGWAVGHGGVVLVTDDGGRHWASQLDGHAIAQLQLQAARQRGDERALADAQRLVAEGADKPLLDLLVRGSQRLLAVGAYGLAVASEDGGRSWVSWSARLPNPKGLHLYAARQHGDTLLIVGEQGLVLLSNDVGQTFRAVETPYKGSFFSAELMDAQHLLVAGLRGNALRSVDGGSAWQALATPMPASITATALEPGGRVLAANQAGFVMALQDDRFQPLHAAPLPPVNGLLPRTGATPLVLGVQGAMSLPESLK